MPSVDIDGVRVNYTDIGSGVAVVFLPGPCGSKEWFCYQSAGLSDHYRVICCDLRRGRGELSLDILADDVRRLLVALRLTDAVVAGHSLGGMIALQFAATCPERCLAAIVSSTSPFYHGVRNDQLHQDLVLCEPESQGFWSKLWQRFVGGSDRCPSLPDPLDYLARNNGGIDRASLAERLSLMGRADLTPVLGRVQVPTLVVAGSEELPYVLAGAQTLDEELPDSSIEIIEGADQFHFYLHHDLFNAAVADFLMHKVARL